MAIETHPFGNFIPKNSKYLLLGSFCTKPNDGYEFFYANKRNQFWNIIENVYGVELGTTEKKKNFFTKLGIAIADIIESCERTKGTNLDNNLKIVSLNNSLKDVLSKNNITKIYFSSRFVENLFKKYFKELVSDFPNIKLITLPSPSPRYAAMTKNEKIRRYKELLPEL